MANKRRKAELGTEENPIILPEAVITRRKGYVNYTGDETYIPSLLKFMQSRRDATIASAINKMLSPNKTKPDVPRLPKNHLLSKLEGYLGKSDEERISKYGLMKHPHTCIYTVTSQFNSNNRVSGNKTFANNPEGVGFTKINNADADHGDLIQFKTNRGVPYHATLLTGFDKDGQELLSYSNGNTEEYVIEDGVKRYTMKKDNPISEFGDTQHDTYRYVGNHTDRVNWEHEYEKLYNKKQFGGQMKKYNPRHKAFIGAIINAATSVASGVANAVMQHKQQLKQNRQDNYEHGLQTAGVLDQLIANQDVVNQQLRNKVAFKYGGRKKCEMGSLAKGILFYALTGAGGIAGAFADRAVQKHDMNKVQILPGANATTTQTEQNIQPQPVIDTSQQTSMVQTNTTTPYDWNGMYNAQVNNNATTTKRFGGRTQMFMCGGRTKRNRRK